MIEVEAFVRVAELGNFTRAAEALGLSQPAVSRRLELIERELGAPLLERLSGSRGARLTVAGEAFLPHAQALLAAARSGTAAVRALENGGSAVTLALVGALATPAFVARLQAFRAAAPRAHVALRTGTSDVVTALVRQGEAHLGLRHAGDPDADLAMVPIGREELVVVCAPGHRVARAGEPLAPSMLAGEPWVTLDGPVLRSVLAGCGLTEAELIEIDSRESQRRLIAAGFGLGLMPAEAVAAEVGLGVLQHVDVPALRQSVPVAVVFRRRGYLPRAARQLLEVLLAGQ